MKDPLICDWLNGNNKRCAGLFGNAGKDLFSLFLRYQSVVSQLSEDCCCHPQVNIYCHIYLQIIRAGECPALSLFNYSLAENEEPLPTTGVRRMAGQEGHKVAPLLYLYRVNIIRGNDLYTPLECKKAGTFDFSKVPASPI